MDKHASNDKGKHAKWAKGQLSNWQEIELTNRYTSSFWWRTLHLGTGWASAFFFFLNHHNYYETDLMKRGRSYGLVRLHDKHEIQRYREMMHGVEKYPATLKSTSTWSCSLARASTCSFLVTSTTLVLIPVDKKHNRQQKHIQWFIAVFSGCPSFSEDNYILCKLKSHQFPTGRFRDLYVQLRCFASDLSETRCLVEECDNHLLFYLTGSCMGTSS